MEMTEEDLMAENAELRNKIRVLEACGLHAICEAYRNIDKCGSDRYLGSAVTITIKNINKTKNTVVEEVAISDGLSDETIAAIKADIKRSHELLMSYPHLQLDNKGDDNGKRKPSK